MTVDTSDQNVKPDIYLFAVLREGDLATMDGPGSSVFCFFFLLRVNKMRVKF